MLGFSALTSLSLRQVLEPSAAGNGAPEGHEQADRLVRACVAAAREVAARGVLLRVTFESLFEYLTVRAAHALVRSGEPGRAHLRRWMSTWRCALHMPQCSGEWQAGNAGPAECLAVCAVLGAALMRSGQGQDELRNWRCSRGAGGLLW